MRTLNLKGMSWIMALAMMFIVSFTSCSDDKEEGNGGGKIEFPTLQEVTVSTDGTLNISFKANVDWKLTSTAGWCKFVNGDFTETTIGGKAGEQTITAKILGDGQKYDNDDIAEIKLSMGGKEEVIYKITRPKKEFKGLTIKDEAGNVYNAENPIVIKGNGIEDNDIVYTPIVATTESNFEVGILPENNPSWITVASTEAGKFTMTFKKDNKEELNYKYSFGKDKGYSVTFSVQTNEGLANVSIPVVYEGLKEGELAIDKQFFNTKVSMDGKKIINSQGLSGESTAVYKDKITTTITTRNDEYQIIKIEQNGYLQASWDGSDPTFIIEDYIFENANTGWVHESKNEANLSLTFDAFTPGPDDYNPARAVIIMALPQSIYNEIKDDLRGNILAEKVNEGDDPEIASRYTTYTVADIKQYDIKVSFDAGFANDYFTPFNWTELYNVSVEEYSGEPIADAGTNNIYTVTIPQDALVGKNTGEMAFTAIAIQVKDNGEELTIEQKNSTTSNLTFKSQKGLKDMNNEQNDGKLYAILTPENQNNNITGKTQIVVKTKDSVEALLLIEFADTPSIGE